MAQETALARYRSSHELLASMREQITKALPKHLTTDRMIRVITTCIGKNPKLMESTPQSLMAAIIQCSELGLEPSVLGHCYLLPFKNKGSMETLFLIGYKGMIDLAKRTGLVSNIYAEIVYEGEQYEIIRGSEDRFHHRPDYKLRAKGGLKPEFVYSFIKYKDGTYDYKVLTMADIYKRKRQSKSADSDYSPWKLWEEEMMMKTAIRAIFPLIPASSESVLAIKEAVATEELKELQDNSVIDIMPPEQKESEPLPEYPKDRFDKNFSEWEELIQKKGMTHQNIINNISSKWTLTEEQEKLVKKIPKKKPAKKADKTEETKTEAKEYPEELVTAVNDCENQEELDALFKNLADDEQSEYASLFENRTFND